jgi:hypothetical protein
MSRSSTRSSSRTIAGSFALDVVLVVVFAVIGRASHHESVDAGGVATTAWPFLTGLVVGWAASLAWRAPGRPVRAGIPIWVVTVAAGMLLRVLSGQGIALAFVIVATIVLALFLVGWRVITAIVVRSRKAA